MFVPSGAKELPILRVMCFEVMIMFTSHMHESHYHKNKRYKLIKDAVRNWKEKIYGGISSLYENVEK